MSIEQEIKQSLYQLKNEGIILYPTDTVWGLGCDATHSEAVRKLYALKKRNESKSLVVLVDSLEMLQEYVATIPETALTIINVNEKPTTIIYNNPIGFPKNVVNSGHTVAIRIPDHLFCKKLIRTFGKPIVSTSANISGFPTPKSFSEITASVLEGVDYIVNLEREKIADKSSTIIKINGNVVEVIRI
ncbi:MAG: threonylcarbamoyl-AMP synthase [Flavobacteriaceae bacterium]|nr:MAG: threonylcarbamoyl-AMP synthase [Flavobacteriaceae bacterium]